MSSRRLRVQSGAFVRFRMVGEGVRRGLWLGANAPARSHGSSGRANGDGGGSCGPLMAAQKAKQVHGRVNLSDPDR